MMRMILSIVAGMLWAVTASADFNAGSTAFDRGDYATALREWKPLAQQGHVGAQGMLGLMYSKGKGVHQDYVEAAKWLRMAAEQGEAVAQDTLGWMYSKGKGVPEDDVEAVKWYRTAAEQGYADAQYHLGRMYGWGVGVPQDYIEAAKWFRMSADQGHASAQALLGIMYFKGHGVPQNYFEATKLFRMAAEQGDAESQHLLGIMYEDGLGVSRDDVEAAKWHRKAAEHGNARSQYILGNMYSASRGTLRDEAEAVKWYRKAAEQGDVEASSSLGLKFYHGHGVPQSYIEAAKWYRKAAEQGDAITQSTLGQMYSKGEGVPRDYVQAYFWFNLAIAGGFEKARKYRDQLEPVMTHDQVARAQRLSSEWKPGKATVATGAGRDPRVGAQTKRNNVEEKPVPAATGSGFFVSTQGHLLTNHHVAGNCRKLRAGIGGNVVDVQLIAHDKNNDLALLKVTKAEKIVPAEFRNENPTRLGESVVVAGYPLRGLLAGDLGVTTGAVAALAGTGDDARLLQISAPVQPGNSGGPLLDESGRVIGVVVAKLDALKVAKATGALPENINFAIKGALARSFLDIHGIGYRTSSDARVLKGEEIAARARAFTAVVECWK